MSNNMPCYSSGEKMRILMLIISALVALSQSANVLIGGNLAGGYTDISSNDIQVTEVAAFVEKTLNERSNSFYLNKVVNIGRVQVQLVNGLNYKMEFDFIRTGCTKNSKSSVDLSGCTISNQVQECTAKVFSPFSGHKRLNDFNCQSKMRVDKRAGGISKVDKPEMLRATAQRAIAMSNAAIKKDFRIVEATTQVVAGQLIRMTIEGTQNDEDVKCHLAVWSRPWLKTVESFIISKFECEKISNEKAKRACGGCVSDEVKDPNSYIDLYIRAFGLTKTNMDINNIEIKSVKTQVVAGIKYIMKVKTSEAGEPRMCDVQLVEQPWMKPDLRVLKFDCKPI